jgi:hypothetical protein
MKNRFAIVLFLIMGLGTVDTLADDISEIQLLDGSVVYGEIISLNEGVYTVESISLGTLEIDGSKIKMIRLKPDRTTGNEAVEEGQKITAEDLEALQKSMEIDQEVIDLILALRDDPQVQDILKDPEIVNALISHDTAALIANPKIIELLNHPKVRTIQKKVLKK